MLIVHVIPPAGVEGGDRHEEHFPDGTSPSDILRIITQPHVVKGKPVNPRQVGYGKLRTADGKTMWYLDHPETVVAIGEAVNGDFVETKRIQGPAKSAE